MESLANAMEKLIRRVLVQSGKCPECSEPLYSWRAKNKDGSERCKPTCMLDLGPVWLDRYVRTVLVESLRIALEQAIVDGTGKDMPVGMMRDMSKQTSGEYAEKTAEPITAFHER